MSARLDKALALPRHVLRTRHRGLLRLSQPDDVKDLEQDGALFLAFRDKNWPADMPEQEFLARAEENLNLFYRLTYRRRFGSERPRADEITGFDFTRVGAERRETEGPLLDALPLELQEAVRYRVIDGLTGDETAAKLRVSRATAHAWVKRGLDLLREAAE